MMTHATRELDDLREDLAELRAELRRAMKTARRGGTAGGVGGRLAGGLARQAAGMATNFAADFVVGRGGLLRQPVERVIARHPFGAAAVALAAVVVFGRYIIRSPGDLVGLR